MAAAEIPKIAGNSFFHMRFMSPMVTCLVGLALRQDDCG
jgi:hypothetical protein